MAHAEIEQLDLWRGEAVCEKMIRMHAAAFGGMGAGDTTMAAPQAPTDREQQLSKRWHGGKVTESPAQTRRSGNAEITTRKTRVRWQGVNPKKG